MLALTPALSHRYLFSASHRPGVGTDAAVSQSRQRLECGDLSPLSSASASQLAADSPVPRAKAPTSSDLYPKNKRLDIRAELRHLQRVDRSATSLRTLGEP